MNSQDLKDLIDYVMKNNSWKEMNYYNCHRKQPKYLDFRLWFTLDTRDGIIFYLKTRHSGKDKSFRVENKKDLEKVYEWLNSEVEKC
jgi:hypothetical protein